MDRPRHGAAPPWVRGSASHIRSREDRRLYCLANTISRRGTPGTNLAFYPQPKWRMFHRREFGGTHETYRGVRN